MSTALNPSSLWQSNLLPQRRRRFPFVVLQARPPCACTSTVTRLVRSAPPTTSFAADSHAGPPALVEFWEFPQMMQRYDGRQLSPTPHMRSAECDGRAGPERVHDQPNQSDHNVARRRDLARRRQRKIRQRHFARAPSTRRPSGWHSHETARRSPPGSRSSAESS
jgi:hypothetical protein